MEWYLTAYTTFGFNVSDGVSHTASLTAGSVSINTWYFLAFGYDQTQIWLSVNNATAVTSAYTWGGWNSTLALGVGAMGNGAYNTSGRIDEVGY
jgi:hypothetical protein